MSLKTLIPKEHGAWVILTLPYFVGATVGGGISGRGILGFFGILLLFLSKQPLHLILKMNFSEVRLQRIKKGELWQAFLLFLGCGTGIFLRLIFRYRLGDLIKIGLIALFLFLFHTYLALYRKERTLIGELLGVALLTISAPVGVVLSGGKLSRGTLILWLLNVFYFSGSIFYIKMRKKAARARKKIPSFPLNINLVKECLAYIVLLIIILVLLVFTKGVPVLVPLAFIPMVIYILWSIIVLRPRFEIMKQGLIQTSLSLIFGVLIIIFWR
ncbi:MAG TPA: hypothetical protein ENI18_01285 [Candidatus Aminicenantes bacterium]|nr:hypothetical protein [Candidatus Aminicenantes bacterium]